jgi:hypothetical protein
MSVEACRQTKKHKGGKNDRPPPVPAVPLDTIRLHIPANLAVVFKQNLVHAGAYYADDNVRLHLYLDHGKCKRRAESFYGLDWNLDSLNVARGNQGKYFQWG